MRTLITFILRLWVDPQAEEPAWEGRIENVGSGEQAHVRSPAELAQFVDMQTSKARSQSPAARNEAVSAIEQAPTREREQEQNKEEE